MYSRGKRMVELAIKKQVECDESDNESLDLDDDDRDPTYVPFFCYNGVLKNFQSLIPYRFQRSSPLILSQDTLDLVRVSPCDNFSRNISNSFLLTLRF